jgi:galactose mutarotase-like enzyme
MVLERQSTPFPHWSFTTSDGQEQLRFVPERGGLITGWCCEGREMLYFDEQRFLDPSLSVRGGIPVLFPICGGLPGDILPLGGQSYGLAQHGFAREQPWHSSALQDGSGVRLQLRDSAATRQLFPFQFQLTMDVRPAASALDLRLNVMNCGPGAMPFSLGLHPYFNVSSLTAVRFEGLPERCLNHHTIAMDSSSDQILRLADGVDLMVRPGDESPPVNAIRLIDQSDHLGLELQLTHPLDLVVIWTDPPRPTVCLEPWTAPRNSLISGDRRLVLESGESSQLRCRYVVKDLR